MDTAGSEGARARAAGLAQALFRQVNERIAEVNGDEPMEIVCECFRQDCIETISVTVSRYEEVRMFPTRFLVKPGHFDLEFERVVEEDDSLALIEKFGEAGRRALRYAYGRDTSEGAA